MRWTACRIRSKKLFSKKSLGFLQLIQNTAVYLTCQQRQTHNKMNKVISLPRNYSWQYRYEVEGCIFTLEQNESGTWYLTGYDSEELMSEGDFFISEAMGLKRHAVSFLKYTFQRAEWSA